MSASGKAVGQWGMEIQMKSWLLDKRKDVKDEFNHFALKPFQQNELITPLCVCVCLQLRMCVQIFFQPVCVCLYTHTNLVSELLHIYLP